MTSLSDQVLLMRKSLDECEKELKSLESGRKASAPRARKSLQALKNSSHAMRKQITESVKSMPVKKKVSKKSEEVLPMEEIKQLQAEPEEPEEPVKKPRKPRVKKVAEKKDTLL